MNILFLERDRAPRRLIKDMIEQAGATLIEIESAADYRQAAGWDAVAIAIIEVDGEGDGLTLIGMLHAREVGRPALIAIAADAAEAEASRRAGADEVLIEPVAMTALFDAVARYLPEA